MNASTTNAPDAYIKLEAIRAKFPNVFFTEDSSEIQSLIDATALPMYGAEWSAIAVVAGDGEIRHAWITESSSPHRIEAEFVQVLHEGKTMAWALDYEASLPKTAARRGMNTLAI